MPAGIKTTLAQEKCPSKDRRDMVRIIVSEMRLTIKFVKIPVLDHGEDDCIATS